MNLSPRQRLCIEIAATAALGKRRALEGLIRSSTEKGIPRRFPEELFIHLSLVLGFPVMLDALECLDRIAPARLRKRSFHSGGHRGRAVLQRIYGDQTDRLLRNLHRLHPEIERWIVQDVYGRVFTRPGLTLRERELINVTVLSIQRLKRQLYSHVRGALRTGVSSGQLEECMNLVSRISGRSLKGPRAILNQVVSQRKKL